jgi:hypothetical protein
MKRLVLATAVLALGVGVACVPTSPPAPSPSHFEYYYTEVHVEGASGDYVIDTACELEGGGEFTHTDTITAGTFAFFNWTLGVVTVVVHNQQTQHSAPTPGVDPETCTVTEQTTNGAAPNGAVPEYWIGTPRHPLTAPTATPQSCTFHEPLSTTVEVSPELTLDQCFYTVNNVIP